VFPDIQEDNFDSSEDDEEKKRNDRLHRIGMVTENIKGQAMTDRSSPSPLRLNKLQTLESPSPKHQMSPSHQLGASGNANKNILIGEKGDILAKYRIPVKQTNIDYDMQLPEVSDSSKFSSDGEQNILKDDDKKEEKKSDLE